MAGSDIEKVVIKTRKLESLLRTQYHAEGQGLHQLITSCETRLPHEVIPKLRYIATIRNKLVHEDRYALADRRQFFSQLDECMKELTPHAAQFIWRMVWGVLLAMTMGCLIYYYLNWESLSNGLF